MTSQRSATRSLELAEMFQRARPRLVRIAYATLGSHAEAEDVVSECWLRLVTADAREPILDVDAWATVVVARGALDTLRSARRRRERYVGPWLPEPIVEVGGSTDPTDRISLDEHVSYALLVVLETLTPAERTAWVLHDLFGLPFTDIAVTVGRSPAAVRQLAARARAHVSSRAPRVEVSHAQHENAVRSFIAAAAGGDLTLLLRALDPDVVLTSDGGGQVKAALRPIIGAAKVGRFLNGVLIGRPGRRTQPLTVNGDLAIGIYDDGDLSGVISLTLDAGRISRIDMIRSPAKLPRAAQV